MARSFGLAGGFGVIGAGSFRRGSSVGGQTHETGMRDELIELLGAAKGHAAAARNRESRK